jgi:hypothetical protein
MIDPEVEPLITLAQATKLKWLPRLRRGRPITFSAFYRWAVHGLGGVKLETLRVGGTMFTTSAAIKRFFAELPSRPLRTRSPRRNTSSAELHIDRTPLKSAAAAEAEAAKLGL